MGPEALGGKRKRGTPKASSVSFRKKEDAFFSVIWINLEPKLIITYNTVYLREMH